MVTIQVSLRCHLSVAVDLVSRHLSAVWSYDWVEVRSSLASDAKLQISHDDWKNSEWDVVDFYRYISQAWDFAPGSVELSDRGEGIVQAHMQLTNGDWAKDVEGEYRVSDDHINAIHLVDSRAFKLPDAGD